MNLKLTLFDRLVNWSNPIKGLKRLQARAAITALNDSGFIIPTSNNKSMKGIQNLKNTSPAQDIDEKLLGSRALSRDLSMNSPLAKATFRRYRTNVVSFGLQVQPRVDKKFLGLSDDAAEEFNEAAIREFDLWADSFESDFEGVMPFNEQQGLMLMSMLIDGDVLFALPMIQSQRKDWPYETCVKLIDADLVRNPNEDLIKARKSTNAKIRNGVEYINGRLSAYWIANHYKNDNYIIEEEKRFDRIPVFDSMGNRQIFHLVEFERIKQRRGMPLFAAVAEELKNISRLTKAELMAHLVAAFFTVVVKNDNALLKLLQQGYTPNDSVTGGGSTEGPTGTQESKTGQNVFDLEMGYGNTYYLNNEEEIQIAETRGGKADFHPLFKAMASQVSAVAELPYGVIMLQFEKSYSAMRGDILEASKRYRAVKYLMKNRACQHCYNAIMTEAVLKDRIKAPSFFKDPVYQAAWTRSKWVGPGQGQIDPLKEARGSIFKIDAALSTREEEYALDRGGRWTPELERMANEKRKIEELGLSKEDLTDQAKTGLR
jgi:lambda family phage portal protein